MSRSLHPRSKARLAAFLALTIAVGLPLIGNGRWTQAHSSPSQASFVSAGNAASVLYVGEDGIGCRRADLNETAALVDNGQPRDVSVISGVETHDLNGLTIVLRATPQLESVPAAKAAFLRVAAVYQSMIRTPITVVIDVDFGPTWFGNEYPEGIGGLTHPQLLVGSPIYPIMQGRLIDGASSAAERDLYYAMPQIAVQTDLGETATVVGPSPLFRAMEFIGSTAVPEAEPGIWGPPPAIGFNSIVEYDFDPTDGVDPGKADFEAAVSHEIGHVLGFVSYTGLYELDDERGLALSVWDLFRVRPGVDIDSFGTAERILSSGGQQVYFAGGPEYGLSTGRPDGTGGDGKQASHWRDDEFSGDRIGIMDPTIPKGKRQTITFKDLAALDVLGYSIRPLGNSKPTISDLEADLNGDVLSVRATLRDTDGDPSRVMLKLIDQDDVVVSQIAPVAEDFGVATKTMFVKEYTGMSSVPACMKVGLVVTDTRGNVSATAVADFSEGDGGGPKLKTASYNREKLSIKAKKFGSQLQIEVNGQVVAPTGGIEIGGSAKKLVINADALQLNLRPGLNRIRVISGGLRSNLLVMEF